MTLQLNLQKGLVGHWTMDDADTSGDTLYDSSAYDNHGTISSPTQTEGQIGGAYDFDGKSDKILTDFISPINQASGLTISAWINQKGNANNSFERHLDLQDKSAGNAYLLYWDDDDREYGFRAPRAEAIINENPELNTWLHWAGVYDGDEIKFYENSVQKSSSPQSGNIQKELALSIGGRYDTNNDGALAKIDDVRLYNRTLSEEEISALYNMRSQRSYNI